MSRLSRRELFEESLFAAAIAATAGAAPAAAAETRSARVVGPNEQLRIAVIGVRSRGKDHLSGYAKMNDVTVAAVCDVDLSTAPGAVKILTDAGKPAPRVVQDLRRIMEDKDIDAVSIATCNHWHALAAIWAMQAGKDVYVEKPVSHNVREGRAMVEAARKYSRICQAGTQIRSMKGSQEAIAYVHAGKIGKVSVARGLCYKPRLSIGKLAAGSIPAGVDFDLWLGPAPLRPFHQNKFHYNWHWQWDTGNGDLGNQGIHQMDVARWGLGKSSLPKRVVGMGGRLGYEDDGETPNTHVAVMDYGDSELIFETRGLKTGDYRGARVGNVFHGSDGYVVLTSYTGGAAFDKDGNMVATFSGGGDHYRNFVDAVRSRKPELLTGDIEEGHLSSALCHLGNISYLQGEWTALSELPRVATASEAVRETFERMRQHLTENGVNPATDRYRLGPQLEIRPGKEDFGRSHVANAMLTRPYRPGFVVPEKP